MANIAHSNYACSMEHLKNGKLSDRLVQFIVKGRLQIAETNVLLQKMYPDVYGKACRLCRNPHDTISHVLNGCMEFKKNYMERHNRIVDILVETIKKYNQTMKMYKESFVTVDLVQGDTEEEIQMRDYFQ